MQKPSSHLTRGYLAAVGAAVFLSATAIFIRHLTLTYQLPALVLAFWRDVFVVLTLAPILALTRPALLRFPRKEWLFLALYGLVLALFNAMWTLSVALNGAAVATVLSYCSTAFTVLLGWLLLKEDLSWAKLLAVALTLGGCVLVAGAVTRAAWNLNLGGILTGVLTGLWYAAYSLMGRSATQRGMNIWTMLLYTFLFASGFLFLANLFSGGAIPGAAARPADFFWLGNAWPGWLVLFLLAAIPSLGGFGLYNISLMHLPSSVTNLIVSLEPVFTAITAYVLLGERLTAPQVFGSLLILGAVIFLRIYEGRLIRQSPTASRRQTCRWFRRSPARK